jgi:glycosyltransferase involved in cell wall biosynthesis
MRKISIIVPVYQNALNIHKCIESLVKLNKKLNQLGYKLEIILVEDGSIDNSYTLLREYLNIEDLAIVKLTRNFGQIPAIQAGLKYAKGVYIGIISADLQDPPDLFLKMVPILESGTKLVIAERKSRDEGYFQRIMSKKYWWLIKKFSMKDFPAGGFDFCMFDEQVAKEIDGINEKNTNIFPLIYWLGFKPKVIKYSRKQRDEGVSTWTFFNKVKLTIDTIIGFTYIPTRIISISAILTSIFAFLYFLYILIMWYFGYGNSPDGWTTIVLLILVVGGMILFSLGILGEYLLRILDEVRNRPNFVIDEVIRKKPSE